MGYFEDFSPGFRRESQVLRGLVAFPYAFPLWLISKFIKTYIEPRAFAGNEKPEEGKRKDLQE